jgi:hypothetical protein
MPKFYEFEVSLRDAEPRPWRRFRVPQGATFDDLHNAIQAACGWGGEHLYVFRTGDWGDPDNREIAGCPDPYQQPPTPLAGKVKLYSWFDSPNHTACRYLYDFGDDWDHDVVLVGQGQSAEMFKRRLVGGEGAFPPENSGGLSGYERLVEFSRTGSDPWGEDPEYLKDAYDDWSPTAVDMAAVQKDFDL